MKTIKVQNNTEVLPIYNAENVESITVGKEPQKVKYVVTDEYVLPIATYAEVVNYTVLDFYSNFIPVTPITPVTPIKRNFAYATQMTANDSRNSYNVYDIDIVSDIPSCEEATKLYNKNKNIHGSIDSDSGQSADYYYNGTVFVNTNEILYYKISVETYSPSQGINRIKNIEIVNNPYTSLEKAEETNNNIIVLEFDEILPKCAVYWCEDNNSKKSSAFNPNTSSINLYTLPTFTGGYGQSAEENESNDGVSSPRTEHWKVFSDPGNGKLYDGQYYLSNESGNIEITDNTYNIYDVLFRQIHDYLYDYNNLDTNNQPTVKHPGNYTFLLKTYKMYIKKTMPDGTDQTDFDDYFSAFVLSEEKIKTLSPSEAQEYFNNTVVYSASSTDKIILEPSDAYDKINTNDHVCGTKCNKYFVISDALCINEANKSTDESYIDLGNFELIEARCLSPFAIIGSDPPKYICKSNTKTTKAREVYDPWNDEYLIISKNNANSFPEEYEIERNSVSVKCVSGKKDIYYFDTDVDSKTAADQMAEDIAYAIEDGPSIVDCQNIITIYSE